jgi:ribosomal protein L33
MKFFLDYIEKFRGGNLNHFHVIQIFPEIVYNVQTTEFECSRCGYRWIGRKNGKERKELPRFCPKCKTWMWNMQRKNDMFRYWREEERQRYILDSKEGEKLEAFFERTKKDRTPFPYKDFATDT